jgi:hypothetical protein
MKRNWTEHWSRWRDVNPSGVRIQFKLINKNYALSRSGQAAAVVVRRDEEALEMVRLNEIGKFAAPHL